MRYSQLIVGLIIGFSLHAVMVEKPEYKHVTKAETFADTVNSITQEKFAAAGSEYRSATPREIKNNQKKWIGKKVKVKGSSNSLADFIKSDGYTIGLACGNPTFSYSNPSGIVVKGVVKENVGRASIGVDCTKPPKTQ